MSQNGKGSRNRSLGKKYSDGHDSVMWKRNPGDGQKSVQKKKKSKPIRFEKPKTFIEKAAELVKRQFG